MDEAVEVADSLTSDQEELTRMITKCVQNNKLGHDGGFSSINGEVSLATVKRLVKAAQIKSEDVVFDAGCSSGRALMYLVTTSNACAGVGIELEGTRFNLANQHNLKLMESTQNVPVHMVHGDVASFKTFEGITVLYMWDLCFTEDIFNDIAFAVNHTSTIRCVITTKTGEELQSYGFRIDESATPSKVNLSALGAKASGTFFVHKLPKPSITAELVSSSEETIDSCIRMGEAIQRAKSFQLRQEEANRVASMWLQDKTKRGKLWSLLDKEDFQQSKFVKTYYPNGHLKKFVSQDFTLRKFIFYRFESTHTDSFYYRPALARNYIVEINAVKTKTKDQALIVPSYDYVHQRVLIGLQYYWNQGNNKLFAITYNLSIKKYIEITYADAEVNFHFDPNLDMPLTASDMAEIFAGYHAKYPAAKKLSNQPKLSKLLTRKPAPSVNEPCLLDWYVNSNLTWKQFTNLSSVFN